MHLPRDTTSCRAHTRRAVSAATLLGLLALFLPATAIGNPAVDEYSLNLPDAKGKVESPERSPTFNPSAALPGNIVAGLERNPSGKALAVIATSRELGAPNPSAGRALKPARTSGVEADQPSTLGAVGGAVGDPATIGLILLVAVAGGAILLATAAGTRGRGR